MSSSPTDTDRHDDTGPAALTAPPAPELSAKLRERSARAGRRAATSTGTRSRSASGQKWMRIVHVYTSMIALVAVLFFSATGITLNHPNWLFGTKVVRTTVKGTLPDGWHQGTTVDWLKVAEYLRAQHSLSGAVADHSADDRQGSIAFKGPGYAADAFFETESGNYEMTIEQQGAVGVLNDLHKGRDSRVSWKWLIDASGIFLVLVSLTGIGLQLFLRKRRRSSLVTATVGGVVLVLLGWLALR